jgi:diaminopimelate decarboxylase
MRDYSRRDFLRQTTVTLAMAALAARALPGEALADTTPDFAGFIDASGEELILGGKPLSWWIETFGLPFHVSYAPDIRANLLAFKEVFERLYPKGEVRYAGKASTHPAVFRLAAEAGVGIDVASPYETRCALEAGVPPGQLDVNGNAKDDDLLNLAIGKDMLIVADMPVRVLGFHTHIGSQINDLGAYQLVLGKLLELGATLKSAGHDFEAVNIGGGFPVSYVTQEEWDQILDRIRDGFIAAKAGDPSKIYMWENRPGDFVMGPDGLPTKDWKGELFTARFPKEKMVEAILSNDITVNGRAMKATAALEAAGTPALMIEPGRSIVSDSGISLARVAFDKKIAGIHDLISLDLGVVNYCEAIVALPARKWALATEPKRRDPQPFETFIAGNLCFSADMLSRLKVAFPRRPERGDVLLISSTGAYNPTFFASNANSYPRPTRVLLEANGDWTYLKRADSYQEIFSLS